jgi:uncharacterized protein
LSQTQVLIVSKGHAYNHDAFLAMFAEDADIVTTLVEQPAAQIVLRPENVSRFDAVLFYDMSGIANAGLVHDDSNNTGQPSNDYRRSIEHLIDSGKGIVLLNHATCSWPDWPLWREIHGSSFMLTEGSVFGDPVPGSGYAGGHGPLPNPRFTLSPVDASHPVTAGLEDGLTLADEIYLKSSNFEANVLPLMRSDYDYVSGNFTPPPMAPAEQQEGWSHPQGSNLVVWANAAKNSPVVASDIGDSPGAFENPGFQRLLKNALQWVASEEARQWAAQDNAD